MSPTLLSKRLQNAGSGGVGRAQAQRRERSLGVHLTQAGGALRPIVDAIGHRGQTWVRSKLTPDELDPGRLMWAMHRHFGLANVSRVGLVLSIEITGAKRLSTWWFIVKHDTVGLCWDDPGCDVDVSVHADLLALTQIYIGDLSLKRARELGKVEITRRQGSRQLHGGLVSPQQVHG